MAGSIVNELVTKKPNSAEEEKVAAIPVPPASGSPQQSAPVTPQPPQWPPVQQATQTSGYAIASLVLGILSIVPGVYLGGLEFIRK